MAEKPDLKNFNVMLPRVLIARFKATVKKQDGKLRLAVADALREWIAK